MGRGSLAWMLSGQAATLDWLSPADSEICWVLNITIPL